MNKLREITRYLRSSRKREIWFVVSLALMGMGTIVFVKLIDNYLQQENWIKMDQPVVDWIYSWRSPIVSRLMLLITMAGNWQMVLLGTFLICIILIRSDYWRYLWVLLITNGTAVTFIELAKTVFERSRPPTETAIIQVQSYSFPSGHSYFAGVYYGLITYFWARSLKKWWQRGVVFGLGLTGIILLSFSRVYLGVHWPTDVLAGLASGAVWLLGTIIFLEIEIIFARERKTKIKSRKELYGMLGTMGIIWILALGLMYSTQKINAANLGIKIIRPTMAAVMAEMRTAPAARLRALVVAE